MWRWRLRKKKRVRSEIYPDEILIDSSNIPEFDREQFEGRLERPLSRRSLGIAGVVLAVCMLTLCVRAGDLQIAHGASYAQQAKDNQLSERVIFADRGEIVDRDGVPLAYDVRQNAGDDFAQRVYAQMSGLAHVVGYVQPPAKDSQNNYYRTVFTGMDGVEKAYNSELSGQNGLNLTETDAHGAVVSQSTEQPPEPGQKLTLSIDANLTQELYNAIETRVVGSKYQGGAGVIMDVQTGELLALTSYPEYSSQALTNGDSAAIKSYNDNPEQPFLDRAANGLYAPGSIVKPVVAIGALTEGVISPDKQILSTGSISVPNPFDPAHPSVFLDWRPNGWVDVRHAIAYSSDVYFYEVGGGYQNQLGLGIGKIDQYFKLFGFGSPTGLFGFNDPAGSVSSIAWKAQNFPGDPWRIGDTYHTAIGQYGTQLTPLQAVREAAAIANGGELLTPTLIASSTPEEVNLKLNQTNVEIVREGMRLGVTDGIAQVVNLPFVQVAAKTGTAQVGAHNEYENSWMIGFFPYDHPRYAYAIVLEKTPTGTVAGSPGVMAAVLNWMHANTPQYLQ